MPLTNDCKSLLVVVLAAEAAGNNFENKSILHNLKHK